MLTIEDNMYPMKYRVLPPDRRIFKKNKLDKTIKNPESAKLLVYWEVQIKKGESAERKKAVRPNLSSKSSFPKKYAKMVKPTPKQTKYSLIDGMELPNISVQKWTRTKVPGG